MKAIDIMFFLMFFNMALSVIGGLGIYQFGVSPSSQEIDTSDIYESAGGVEEYDYDLNPNGKSVATIMGSLLFSSFTSLMIGGIVGIIGFKVGGITGDKAFAYGAYTTIFWTFTINSATIFWSLVGFNFGMGMIIVVFLLACGAIFFIGFQQLITGGWRAYQ